MMKKMMSNELLLHLSLINGVGSSLIDHVITGLSTHTDFDIYTADAQSVSAVCSITLVAAQKIVTGLADTTVLHTERALLERHGIQWTTILNADYPDFLKKINTPPAVIYWRGGAFPRDVHHLAMVGSRASSAYGERVVRTLMPDIVSAGIVTVSGGALGIDTIVHEQTVKHNGITIAVLGSGLLNLYPTSNRKLFESIIANNGIVMSAFQLNELPLPGNFPARNRIISGLSHGCLVVQAAEKSGALITAHYALEQGREVFAIPGLIDDPLSVGCHKLVQAGAKLVSSSSDILNEFALSGNRVIIPANTHVMHDASLSDVQKNLLTLCSRPSSINDLLNTSGLSLQTIQNELFQLQLDGRVTQDFVGMWVAL